MNKKLTTLRYFYLGIVVLLCGFMGIFSVTPSSADEMLTPPTASPTAVITDQTTTTRADMFEIADRYMRYRWVAVNDHPFDHTDMQKNDLHDSYYDINAPDRPHVDTPDKRWCDDHINVDLGDAFQWVLSSSWGCWDYAPAINIGP